MDYEFKAIMGQLIAVVCFTAMICFSVASAKHRKEMEPLRKRIADLEMAQKLHEASHVCTIK